MKVSDAERRRIASGCHCKECFGLAEVMIQMHGEDFGLKRAPGHETVRLRVTTKGTTVVACDGSMTCSCEKCVGEREARTAKQTRQPWEPRPARSTRAAP